MKVVLPLPEEPAATSSWGIDVEGVIGIRFGWGEVEGLDPALPEEVALLLEGL